MSEIPGVFKIGPNGEVNLPPASCSELGIKPGDTFKLHVEGNKIILFKT